jgi:hypothetical protein
MFYNTELQHKLKCKLAPVTKLNTVNAYHWVDFGRIQLAQLVEALPYNPQIWVQFSMVPLEFFIEIIFLAALWPWGRLSL